MEITQKFLWHAETGTCRYGEDGYLLMDGSVAEGMKCSRKLQTPIDNSSEGIELCMRVVVGNRYAVRLFNSADRLAYELLISEDGWIWLSEQENRFRTKCYLTWFRGRPGPVLSLPCD